MAHDDKQIEKKISNLRFHILYPEGRYDALYDAMCVNHLLPAEDTGKSSRDYYNESLATLGDSILESIIVEAVMSLEPLKGRITQIGTLLGGNTVQHKISEKLRLKNFAYKKEGPGEEGEIPSGKHKLYFEAVVGAMYIDHGYEVCRNWVHGRVLDEHTIIRMRDICEECELFNVSSEDSKSCNENARLVAEAYFEKEWSFHRGDSPNKTPHLTTENFRNLVEERYGTNIR